MLIPEEWAAGLVRVSPGWVCKAIRGTSKCTKASWLISQAVGSLTECLLKGVADCVGRV